MPLETLLSPLKERLAEVHHLRVAEAVLAWDEQTYMPPEGAAARARVKATLNRLAHERFTDPEIGRLLDRLAARLEAEGAAPDSDEGALVRVVRREYEKAVKIPPRLAAALSEAASEGYQAWIAARSANDFTRFRDALSRILDLQRELARALGYRDHPYDALLDQYEPDLTTSEVDSLFARLRQGLIPLVRAISERLDAVDDGILRQPFDEAAQWQLTEEALRAIGFDFRRGRQDRTIHPFCTGFSPGDVRVTTRIEPEQFAFAFFASLHEGGHALYEQGLPEHLAETPLGAAVSLGVHESQSRLWENLVGRSPAFWRFFLPVARRAFPRQLGGVTPEDMYRAVNRVEPSLIRVEADEVTYNLHIMLRFDLEKELIQGDLPVDRLPDRWAEKMEEYVGVTPPDHVQGVLQDVHWSLGAFGYFPTYTVGNLLAVQFYRAAVAAHPHIPDAVERGDFSPLLQWLRTHIHVHGSRYTPDELTRRATGGPLAAEPFLDYIWEKYRALYGVTPASG